jgi:HAD superfamily hydrolase (TIGR01450 family)
VIADTYDAFLFDLDGVLYRGADPVPHAAESLARLRSLGRRVAFVTNNSGRTPERVAERLGAVGIDADVGEVETSALATASILADRGIRRAFVIGGRGIVEALGAAGIEVAGGEPAEVDAVVVGWDRDADYTKLRVASVLVEHGAALVATNADASFPAADRTSWPGAGALLAAVETTTGIRGDAAAAPPPSRAPFRRPARVGVPDAPAPAARWPPGARLGGRGHRVGAPLQDAVEIEQERVVGVR